MSLMITRVEQRWRTFSFWVWQWLRQHFDAQAMRDEHDVLRKVDFPCSHSNILKRAESNMWTAPQTCDKNDGRQREAKLGNLNELIRLRARTPCWQATVCGIFQPAFREAFRDIDQLACWFACRSAFREVPRVAVKDLIDKLSILAWP